MALARAWKQMSWFYYQYLLVTALYMLEPWERTVFSILPGPGVRGPGREHWGPGRHPSRPRAWGWGERRAERWSGAREPRARTGPFPAGARGGGPGAEVATPDWGVGRRARTLEIRGRW